MIQRNNCVFLDLNCIEVRIYVIGRSNCTTSIRLQKVYLRLLLTDTFLNEQVVTACNHTTIKTKRSNKLRDTLLSGKGLARRGLFLRFHFGHCSVEHLHPARDSFSHAHVQVCFGALNVVVQVVAEARQQRDGLFFAIAGHVALLQGERNVARGVSIERAHQARELSWRLLAVIYRRGGAHSALGLDELLQEHSSQGSVSDVVEVHLEDHHHLGARGHNEHRLGFSVLNRHAGKVGRLVRQQRIEGPVERTTQQVPLELTDGVEELRGITGQVVAVELHSVVVVLGGTHLHAGEQPVQH